MRRKWTFSKLLLLLESAVVLYFVLFTACLLYTSDAADE